MTDGGVPVASLNELEFVKGEVLANVWTTDFIVRIDPATGRVTGWIDLRGLLPARERAGDAVLNGIAYDAAADRLFVTGKLWPRLFEIKLVSRPSGQASAVTPTPPNLEPRTQNIRAVGTGHHRS